MSVNDGEKVNAAVTNAAFMSRKVDTSTVGKVDLLNPDSANSGSTITNTQREHNSIASFVGKGVNLPATQKPTWASDVIGAPNDDVKTRVENVQSSVEGNIINIDANTNDISDIRATTGTNDGDLDMGNYTAGANGFSILDGQPTKTNIQELIDGVDSRVPLTEKGAANGVASLDSTGRIPSSQLPLSAMEYKGNWDASTNTPTLANGVGTSGDFYNVSAGGTVDFGAGAITFNAGDSVMYNGSIWEKHDNLDEVTLTNSVALTNKTMDALSNTFSNFKHGVEVDEPASGVHGVVGNILGDSDAQNISNKTFTDNVTVLEQSATPATPSAGAQRIYPKSDGKWYTLNSGGIETEVGSGAGGSGGAKNYFDLVDDNLNKNIITQFEVFDDGGSYVDGTGGTPTALSISSTNVSTELLEKEYSLKISKAALDATGEGVSLVTRTIDRADLGREQIVSIEIDFTDANYIGGDFTVKAYSIDDAIEIPVIGLDNGLPKEKGRVTFRVLPTSTTNTYRLSLFCSTDSSTASTYSLIVDSFKAVIEKTVPGVIKTPLKKETTVIRGETSDPTKGTIVVDTFLWRRDGDVMEIFCQFEQNTAGSAGGGSYYFELPNSEQVSSDITLQGTIGANNSRNAVGQCRVSDGTNAVYGNVFISRTNGLSLLAGDNVTNENIAGSTFFSMSNANTAYSFTARIPIEGWESSNLISTTENLFKGALTKLNMSVDQSVTSTAATKVLLDTVSIDKTNIADPLNNRVIISQSGNYYIEASVLLFNTNTSEFRLDIYVNGVAVKRSTNAGSATAIGVNVFDHLFLNKGDIIELYVQAPGDSAYNISSLSIYTSLTIQSILDTSVFSVYGPDNVVESSLQTAAWSVASSTWGDLTSIVLNPGKWDIDFIAVVDNGASDSTWQTGISSTPGNVAPGGGIVGVDYSQHSNTANFSSTIHWFLKDVIVTNTTTYYAKLWYNLTGGSAGGKISARKVV